MSANPELHGRFVGLIESYEAALRRLCAAYSSVPADRDDLLDGEIQAVERAPLRRLAIAQALGAMSPADRTMTLLWLEGLSAAEIEEVTGVKAATVAVRLSRLRKQLSPGG